MIARWRLAFVLLLAASSARADRTLYGWLPQTTTIPDGSMELDTSLYEHDNLGPFHERSTWLVWTPVVALTRDLELAFPVALATRTEDDAAPWSGIARYGAELRWRLPPHGRPLHRTPLHSLARFAIERDVAIQSQVHTEAEVAASYDLRRVNVEAAVGGVLDVNFSHLHAELHPGVGASVRVTGELRLGAELHAELSRDRTVSSWAAVGPDVAWQRGRFWLAGAFGIGIVHVTAAPRLDVGMVW